MQLTVRDVARLLSVSEKTVYRWIKDRSLPAYRINDQYMFHRADLLEWATANRIALSTDIFEDADPSAEVPSLADAVAAGGVCHGVVGSDTALVLAAAVKAMRLPEEVDREELLRVLIARETLASTGVGDGIAIPHVRNPIVLHVPRPTITLCFLERPVEFGALDGKPVHSLFMLVSPTVRAHLQLLSRLAFALHDTAFRDALARQVPQDEILAEIRRIELHLSPRQESAPVPAP